MKKKLLNLSICTFIVLNFTGCFGESVSCSGKAENELVKEKTIPKMKEYMIAQLLNEKKDGNGMKYFFLKKASEAYGVKPDLSKEFKDLPEIEAEVEKEFTNLIFALGETRTLSKNTELNSVECVGKIGIATSSRRAFAYDVEYNSQLSDNKKKIFVEVSNLE